MGERKQIPLRIPSALADALAAWAEDDLRSLNSQIEWILTMAVRRRKRSGGDDGAAES